MSRCKQCNVNILDATNRCPLCDRVLERSEQEQNTYPDIRLKARKLTFVWRILCFGAVAIEIALLTAAVYTKISFLFVVIPALFFFYGLAIFRYAVIGKSGHQAKIIVVTILFVLIQIALDYSIGYHGWSLNYVFPAAILAIDTGILILMFVNKRNWQSYIMLEILMVLLSAAGLLFFLLELVTDPIVITIAFDVSLVLLLGTLILGGRRARTELRRRFHIH